jgi:hypothetical protein
MPFTHLDIVGPVATLSLDHAGGNRINFDMRVELSTTLADLFTPLLSADLSSAVRASLRSWLNDEIDDGLAYGR